MWIFFSISTINRDQTIIELLLIKGRKNGFFELIIDQGDENNKTI